MPPSISNLSITRPMRRHSHIRLLADGIRTSPHTRHRLQLSVKVDTRLAVERAHTAARDTLLVAGEGEHGERHGDGHVDTDLAGLDPPAEGLGCGAGAGEDGDTVAILVRVDEVDGLVERVDVEADQDGAEDLLPVAAHGGGHVGDDGGGDPVAVGVLLGGEAAAVEEDLGAFFFGRGDEGLDALLGVRGDHGSQVGAGFETAVDAEALGAFREVGEPFFRLADHDEGRQGHAALAGGSKGGSHNGVEELVLVAVGEDGSVVLGAEVGLNALAVGGAAGEDVFTGFVTAHEGDGLDGGFVKDEVYGVMGAMNDVHDTRWETSFLDEFGQDHGCAGVALGRLEDQGVAGDGGDGNAPERDHGGEVWVTVS